MKNEYTYLVLGSEHTVHVDTMSLSILRTNPVC